MYTIQMVGGSFIVIDDANFQKYNSMVDVAKIKDTNGVNYLINKNNVAFVKWS